MWQLVVAGILLVEACRKNEDDLPLDGSSGEGEEAEAEAEGETGKDYGLQTMDHGLGNRDLGLITPDAETRRDVFVPDAGSTTPDAGPDAGAPTPPRRADVNIFPGTRVAIFAADFFGTRQGTLFSLDLDPIGEPVSVADFDSTDVTLHYQEGNLYPIDRTHAAVHVYDGDFNFLRTCNVGEGSNPQAIVVLPGGEKAYVSRLEAQNDTLNTDDVFIINPNTCEFLGSLSLLSCAEEDGEQLARAAQMALRQSSEELFVNVQDLSRSYSADTNGKVAVINTNTDEVIDCIELTGRNPADITYSEINDKVYVTETGVYEPDYTINPETPYGGIESINPDTLALEGMIDDLDLGGAPSEIRLASGTIGEAITVNYFVYAIASFDPERMVASGEDVYLSPGYFLPAFSFDALGRRVIAEQGTLPEEAEIRITGETPVPLGMTPGDLVIVP